LTAPATTPFIILTTPLQYQEVSRETTKCNKVYFPFLYSLYKENQVIAPARLYMQNEQRMCLAHSCACGGRLRHLHCTPQCASL